jgi:gamma-carbonic anhydrase
MIASRAWVAPTATINGAVSLGAHSQILHGAVVTADGGPVTIGDNCVIMEGAALRGTKLT